MLTTSASLALGFAFVLVGAINVWLVLEAWSRVKAANASSRMLALHRIGGYVFITLFCVMTYFMVARLRSGGAETSPNVTIHLALAMILSPLLFIKVLIARYYKNQHGLLMPIGLTIFVLAFVLIASTAGPYLARPSKVEQVVIDPSAPVTIDVNQANDLMQRRCSKCHNLDRVVGARKDTQGWIATVSRMRAMTGAGISDADARTIISYLASRNEPKGPETTVKMEVARALVDQRCGRCHGLDRVYKAVETPADWREIVTRMVGYAAGSAGALQPGEDEKIIGYLSATQTPQAVAQRRAKADAAASAGQSLIAQSAPAAPTPAAETSRYDGKTIGFVSLVCLAGVVLVIRRPRTRGVPPASEAPPVKAPAAVAPRAPAGLFLLQLVQITRQTPDSATLRFAVIGERKLDARPGQFLTFSFLFDGKKETRCYSICSSPARSGYIEITPKRVDNGCVSVFLNDRAAIGMTVEAAGPSGQFYLAPEDKKIVLVAAGSGITPMIAMLRYLDDLCLDTHATLLYSVRTRDDIMFRQEFAELSGRLKNFRYDVLLSRPDADWPGARGRISREFIAKNVADLEGRMFFLCGPPPFMAAVRGILRELGVAPERIRQETFGGAGAEPKPALALTAETGFMIEFASSGKTAAAKEGQSILEAAAQAGVEIPSACRQGQCGTCKTRLLSGNVQMMAEQGLDPESKARGFVLTCVGHAGGNVRLDA
jgi:ferredoxin-NADP reductase/mono/diheme cytochrome c family protein